MRIVFIASNPKGAADLGLVNEINALQQQLLESARTDVSVVFLPNCTIEDLPQHLAAISPDVIHISAHGEDEALLLADIHQQCRPVTAEMVRHFANPRHPPKLVYLSACDSAPIARKLAQLGLTAIGATAPITNGGARAAAANLYSRLADGFSIDDALQSSRHLLAALTPHAVTAELHEAEPGVSGKQPLVFLPTLIAETTRKPKRDKKGKPDISFRIGLLNIPNNTTRIVFFSPDAAFEDDEGLESCTYEEWSDSTCWSGEWYAFGNLRLVATGATPSGDTFCASATLTEAMQNCIAPHLSYRTPDVERLQVAIDLLSAE